MIAENYHRIDFLFVAFCLLKSPGDTWPVCGFSKCEFDTPCPVLGYGDQKRDLAAALVVNNIKVSGLTYLMNQFLRV